MRDAWMLRRTMQPWKHVPAQTWRSLVALERLRRTSSNKRGRSLALGVLLLLTAVTLVSSDASAEWRDTRTRIPVRDTEWRKTSGGLGAMLVVTDSADAFVEEWTRTPEAHIPMVRAANRVRRGATVTALLFISGCGKEGGSCNAVVDFKVLRPDGSVYGELPRNVAYVGPAPRRGIVLLSRAHLVIRIEPTDPYGTYPVIAVLEDRQTRGIIRLKQKFDVTP